MYTKVSTSLDKSVYLWQVQVQTLQSLAPATVLQKLCLFNCKLDQEAAEQLVACLEDGGFSNLQELDLAGNNIEAPQMQALLQTLQHRDSAPSLKVKCALLSCNKAILHVSASRECSCCFLFRSSYCRRSIVPNQHRHRRYLGPHP